MIGPATCKSQVETTNPSRRTVFVVKILNMEGKLSTLDDIPVELVPVSQSRELWAWKPGERTQV